MDKASIVMAVLVIVLFFGEIVFCGTAMADEPEAIVGSTPGVPACKELNEKLYWTEQTYLYQLCEENGIDYCFALGIIEHESQFKSTAYNKQSIDYGLMQINRQWVSKFIKMGWISGAVDLYDTKTNIKCGIYILAECVLKYGNTEQAYCYYNTGNPSIKSNASSRAVMKYAKEWKEKLGK